MEQNIELAGAIVKALTVYSDPSILPNAVTRNLFGMMSALAFDSENVVVFQDDSKPDRDAITEKAGAAIDAFVQATTNGEVVVEEMPKKVAKRNRAADDETAPPKKKSAAKRKVDSRY